VSAPIVPGSAQIPGRDRVKVIIISWSSQSPGTDSYKIQHVPRAGQASYTGRCKLPIIQGYLNPPEYVDRCKVRMIQWSPQSQETDQCKIPNIPKVCSSPLETDVQGSNNFSVSLELRDRELQVSDSPEVCSMGQDGGD
jgi:hypothetical protein